MRTFDRLGDEELARYLDSNVRAVRDVAAAADIEAGFANHVLMGPVILARGLGDLPYAVKVHGSALEYTLKPHYKRFAPYASEGLVPARAVLVGSRHTAESLWAAMPLEDLRERTFLSPPGVDTHTFAPREPEEALAGLDALERWLGAAQRDGFGPAAAKEIDALCDPRRDPPSGEELAQVRSGYDPAGVDVEAPDALAVAGPHPRSGGLLRRQADRLEGNRPAAGRVAAGAGTRAAGEAGRGRVRDLQGRSRGAAARTRAGGRAAADARLPAGPRAGGRAPRPAHLPAHFPGGPARAPRALLRRRQEDAAQHRLHRPPRPRRAGPPAARAPRPS